MKRSIGQLNTSTLYVLAGLVLPVSCQADHERSNDSPVDAGTGPCDPRGIPFGGAIRYVPGTADDLMVEFLPTPEGLTSSKLLFADEPGLSLDPDDPTNPNVAVSPSDVAVLVPTDFPLNEQVFDAVSWGLDWIPVVDDEQGGPWVLDPLEEVTGDLPGFGILFFERDGNVHGYGWGPTLADHFALDPTDDEPPYAPLDGSTPLHLIQPALPLDGEALVALDFNTWVHSEPSWTPCFQPPGGIGDTPVRLYFSRPGGGVHDGRGATIWWTEAQINRTTGLHEWTRPREWLSAGELGLDNADDIDALAIDFVGPGRFSAPPVGEEAVPQLGVVVFSLVDAPVDESLEEASFYAALIEHDGQDVVAVEQPKPLVTPQNVPFHVVSGPRPGGGCGVDPRSLFDRPRGKRSQ